jgi:hypothetical protein
VARLCGRRFAQDIRRPNEDVFLGCAEVRWGIYSSGVGLVISHPSPRLLSRFLLIHTSPTRHSSTLSAMTAAVYNTLPTLGDADRRFTDRSSVFERLAPVLAQHQNQFGVCLVHAHCALEDGEIMVSDGDISEPKRVLSAYPERWLSSGEPFEFSHAPVPVPSSELVKAFQEAVGEYADLLGLCYAGDFKPDVVKVESTDGRKNITRDQSADADRTGCLETAWIPGTAQPVKMACFVICNMRMTRARVTHTGGTWHTHVSGEF